LSGLPGRIGRKKGGAGDEGRVIRRAGKGPFEARAKRGRGGGIGGRERREGSTYGEAMVRGSDVARRAIRNASV